MKMVTIYGVDLPLEIADRQTEGPPLPGGSILRPLKGLGPLTFGTLIVSGGCFGRITACLGSAVLGSAPKHPPGSPPFAELAGYFPDVSVDTTYGKSRVR